MRIKTFTAPTIGEAMADVRQALGPGAIIISTFEAKRGRGVEVCAAVEGNAVAQQAPPAITPQQQTPLADTTDTKPLHNVLGQARRIKASALAGGSVPTLRDLPPQETHHETPHETGEGTDTDTIKRALGFHNCSRQLGSALLSAYNATQATNPLESLTQICDLRFSLSPVPLRPARPILLVGPAGTGKTAISAKLAARALLQGADPHILSTDTIRAGAVEQLNGLIKAMNRQVITAESPEDLRHHIDALLSSGNTTPSGPIFIDTPATNPYAASEMEDLQRFILETNTEPVLVLAAGGDGGEQTDMCNTFAELGVQRMILTRLDTTRRLGSSLSAVDAAGLSLANYSDSPYVGRGLDPFTPHFIAERLLTLPQSKSVKLNGQDDALFVRKAQ